MGFRFPSSDISQKPEGDQRARKRLICSHTREGRGSALVAYHFPELDGRLEGLHIYTGHLSKLKSSFNCQICQMCREREGAPAGLTAANFAISALRRCNCGSSVRETRKGLAGSEGIVDLPNARAKTPA